MRDACVLRAAHNAIPWVWMAPFRYPVLPSREQQETKGGRQGLKPKVGGAVLAHSMRKELSLLG